MLANGFGEFVSSRVNFYVRGSLGKALLNRILFVLEELWTIKSDG